MSKITPPWSPEQVAALNAWQANGRVHPFTCGNRDTPEHDKDGGQLIADKTGWRCPVCGYRQYWAHDFMVQP